jgi:SAM-dependent MidA family methyltransferase
VTSRGIPIHWHHLLREVPSGQSGLPDSLVSSVDHYPVFVGHEILDAFPIYQFVKSSGKWKEVLVDVDFTEESKHHFRFAPPPSLPHSLRHAAADSFNLEW